MNVFALHRAGIAVAHSLIEMRRLQQQALEENEYQCQVKIHAMVAQFNISVLDNELAAQQCYQRMRLVHSMNRMQQIMSDISTDEQQGLIIVSGNMDSLGKILLRILKYACLCVKRGKL